MNEEPNENKESEPVKPDVVNEESKKAEDTKSGADAKLDQAKKAGTEALATSKEIWGKLKPKLKTAYDTVSKEAAHQMNDESSVTRRLSKKAYESAKSGVHFAKAKIKEKQAAKKNTTPEQKPSEKKEDE
ncbi:MAG: hypothetical protein K0U29_08805 [Gammaproteobacteria bacterium]|nr:hypothetical protein [Gammaproteobacteria bacterium]